jgi:hypothetical protein
VLEEIEKKVADDISEMTPYAEASAAYHYDFDFVEMHFKGIRLVKPDENTFEFQIVQIGKDEIVARLDVEITLKLGHTSVTTYTMKATKSVLEIAPRKSRQLSKPVF